MERWKYVPGSKKLYSVSNFARVRNNKTKQLLKIQDRINGTSIYQRVCLIINGKKKWYYMQVLVKYTFEPIENFHLYDVDHLDWNTRNNCLYNLKYSLKLENQKRKLKSSDSYKLFKNLIQAYGDKIVYNKLKSINYVDSTKNSITQVI